MRRRLALLAFAVLGLLALELSVLGSMKPLDNRLLDAFVKRQAASVAPDPDVVLVTIEAGKVQPRRVRHRFYLTPLLSGQGVIRTLDREIASFHAAPGRSRQTR
jgi:hypothetical protein